MQTTYKYTPKYRPFAGATAAFLLLVSSFLLSFFSLRTEYGFLFTAGALLLLVPCFEVFFRYCLVRYEYVLQGNILRVVRKAGKYQTVVFDLSLSLASGITNEKRKKNISERFGGKKIKFFSLYQNLFAKEKFCLVYTSGLTCGVFLEINGEFADKISDMIKPNEWE